MSALETRIRGVRAGQLGVATVDLDREISLVDDLAADSLDLDERDGEVNVRRDRGRGVQREPDAA
jgi:hypothetical protein